MAIKFERVKAGDVLYARRKVTRGGVKAMRDVPVTYLGLVCTDRAKGARARVLWDGRVVQDRTVGWVEKLHKKPMRTHRDFRVALAEHEAKKPPSTPRRKPNTQPKPAQRKTGRTIIIGGKAC